MPIARRLLLVGCAMALLQDCASQAPHPVRAGTWGGDKVEVVVTASGGSLQLCCATGSVDQALTLDGSGHFEANGTYTYLGGPIPVGGNQPVPAQYSGLVQGSTMTLSIGTPSGTLGPFTLMLGQAGSFKGCVCPL